MNVIHGTLSVLRTVWNEPSNRGERLRRLLLAVAWQVYKRTVKIPLVLTLDNGKLFYVDPRAGNSVAAIYTRIYESRYIRFVREHCVPGGMIVDVGAHTGIYTLLLAELFASGMCFEPAPDTFLLLSTNLALNRLHQFEARPQAVSSTCGVGTLVVQQEFSGTAALKSEPTGPGRRWKVELTTIDTALAKCRREITFLKVDTEGHESEVLQGATEALENSKRALVVFENHIGGRERCIAHLKQFGYRCFSVDAEGKPEAGDASFGTVDNIVACGPEHPLRARLR